MSDFVSQFYNSLAADYHSMYSDWREEVRKQGTILNSLLSTNNVPAASTILDCTCGIGTQAIGLALHGYNVRGTDITALAIERAREEVKSFGVQVPFDVADLLQLDSHVTNTFDVVISCDNSLSHFLEDADLKTALRQIRARLKPGGTFLASIRDYDKVVRDRQNPGASIPSLPGAYYTTDRNVTFPTLPRVFEDPQGRRIVFQIWDWAEDGRSYKLQHFHIRQDNERWGTECYVTRFRALQRAEMTTMLQEAGFSTVRWILPEESGYYQPVVLAH